ncbi:NADH-quinone oxidoreductase subunit L [Halospeciosus flavus]|uniref:NADH-quinone oxidoreductase subunit L n=1 Tax=Halospeciosus flavus TaxID=3032283 RepID=A0ABD5Z431_9EURY|nr:NADH-quinone oxidoreductase subunit L [Halospeciosus flavus]
MAGAFAFAAAVPVLPLVAFLIALLVGYGAPRLLPKGGALPGILATAGSLLLSVWLAVTVAGGATYDQTLYTWVAGQGTFDLTFGLLVDPLSAMMAVVVSLVSLLVHVFSLGYMNDEGEGGLPRYYAGLGLFTASMLGFALASNLVMAFVFFELVGFCSWWLIGHWFREPGPASAAKKAFLVTRFGDFFFLVGVVGVLGTFGTAAFTAFPETAAAVLGPEGVTVRTFFGLGAQNWFAVLGLLILGGVVGKSAQFPLQTWLPDAMEGPTPVSALIHAATMVAAGVFLVARMYGFYALLPTVLAIIALIGGFTALFAATMGVVKREIKQVLAYSTISQYGYMMLGLGAGGYVAGTFHLLTHAVFKSLLFLGAGAVIVAMHHEEDMWKMGGLKEKMPVVYWSFLVGSLALAGIVPFAGFWSKDAVLHEALVYGAGGHPALLAAWAMGLLAVFFTGFYTFRMVLLTFHGEPRSDAAESAHDVGWNMKVPVAVLGVGAVVVGFVNPGLLHEFAGVPLFLENWLSGPIEATSYEHYHHLLEEFAGYHAASIPAVVSAALSLGLALAGVGVAWVLYSGPEPEEHTEKLGAVKTLWYNNYYQDEVQVWLAESVAVPVARAVDTFDQSIVDGVVDGVSSVSVASGKRVKRIQSGVVTDYATMLTLGLVALLVVFGILGGWF